MDEDFIIAFAKWFREVDTPENAEVWFGFSDKDMLETFKEIYKNTISTF